MKPGDIAPDFTLLDQSGQAHSLKNYRGHWVVLYFYPKDDTPGCTAEACAFRDTETQFKSMDVAVLGVSTDSQSTHLKFADKYQLGFPILSDSEGSVAKAYGSLFNLWPFRVAKRHTFIIDPEGRVAVIDRKVEPKKHSSFVIQELRRLMDE